MVQIPEIRYAPTSDGEVAYQVFGDGPHRILWIPDWHNPIEMLWEEPRFQRFCAEIARIGSVIVFDKRGTGVSDPIPTHVGLSIAPTVELATEDAAAVLDAEHWPHACVVGIGCGGWVAAMLAASAPGRVSRLVLVDAIPGLQATADFPTGLTSEESARFIQWIISVNGTGRTLRLTDPVADRDREFRRWYGRLQRFAMPQKWMKAFWTSIGDLNISSVLSSITAPTLVMNRTQSAAWPVDRGRALAQRIPGAEFRELPGRDQLFYMDPGRMLAELQEFLTGERAVSAADRVLATILFTDIAGSTELLAALGDRAWRDLLARHNDLVRRELKRFRGREMDSAGDGFLSSFDGPARAVQCAASIRDGVRSIDLAIRAGIHVGECELLDEKISGIAVHTAARVMAAAQPGEILVTRTIRELTAGSGLEFEDRGSHSLKGVPDVWQLYALQPRG